MSVSRKFLPIALIMKVGIKLQNCFAKLAATIGMGGEHKMKVGIKLQNCFAKLAATIGMGGEHKMKVGIKLQNCFAKLAATIGMGGEHKVEIDVTDTTYRAFFSEPANIKVGEPKILVANSDDCSDFEPVTKGAKGMRESLIRYLKGGRLAILSATLLIASTSPRVAGELAPDAATSKGFQAENSRKSLSSDLVVASVGVGVTVVGVAVAVFECWRRNRSSSAVSAPVGDLLPLTRAPLYEAQRLCIDVRYEYLCIV